jgi:glycosyltransferase involved in cell wall biosynthesis
MEGFGIPVLESLDLGKPVLASWSSSIPEVGREAVMYFDPLSKADFIRGVRRLYEATSDPRSALSHTAERVASRFTPESFYQPFRSWILG